MDYQELLLADRLRSIAMEKREAAYDEHVLATDRAATYSAPERARILDQWKTEHQYDTFIGAALDELRKIAGFVKGNG